MQTVQIQLLNKISVLPSRATSGSAGYDLCACLEQPITINPQEQFKIPTGIALSIGDPNVVGLMYARSSLAVKLGLSLINAVGVIDSDYRGELLACLFNNSKKAVTIENGQRIAQLVFTPIFTPTLLQVETLDETTRGAGGFGSTGA